MEEITLESLEAEFPIKKNYAYFMTAASGPLPLSTHNKFVEFSELLLETGSVRFPKWLSIAESARKSVGQLLNCNTESIAFVKNTGIGLWIASRMLDWQAGDEVIVPSGEFPSNLFPWLSLQSKGVNLKYIEPVDGKMIPEVTVETVEPVIQKSNGKCRLLAVSFVQFDDGSRRNLKELSELCKKYDITFVVDAIQGLGALPVDLSEIEVDFLCAGSQKWLLSPPGVAILFVHPRWLERKVVPNIGWLSVSDPYNTNTGAYVDCLERVLPDARRFEEGTSNFAGIAALGQSVSMINNYGIEAISSRVERLTDSLVEQLVSLDCQIISPRSKSLSNWSGIVSFQHEKLNSREIDKGFHAQNIITTVRNEWVRVAVDFFNDDTEIQRLTDSLKAQLG